MASFLLTAEAMVELARLTSRSPNDPAGAELVDLLVLSGLDSGAS